MSKVTYQEMEFDEEELAEIRKENRNSYSLINPMEFSRMVNPIRLDEKDSNKPYKAIITDIPGYGKTTSIFEYMSQRLKLIGTYHAVYSASRISDVYHMFLKFVAEFKDKYKFSLFTSDKKYCNVKDLTELYYSRIIFLCHERLFVEPFSLLYKVEYNPLEKAMYSFSISPNRDDIFIDEIPSNLYKSISLNQRKSLETLNYLAYGKRKEFFDFMQEHGFNPDATELKLMKETARSSFVRSIIESRITARAEKKNLLSSSSNIDSENIVGTNQSLILSSRVIDEAPTTVSNPSKSITKDIAGIGLNNERGFFLLSKLTYFINVFANKYEENPLAEDYSEILIKILEDNPEEIVLVYTWKNSRSKSNTETEELFYDINDNLSELPSEILQYIPNNLQNRIKFITYQSGKEQSTNEYLDCGVMVILGEFFIPQHVIDCRNQIFGSKSTQVDYTKHLMIQAIYRTRARKHFDSDKYISLGDKKIKSNSVRFYLDDRYGQSFIKSLLSEFKLVNHNSINSKKIRPEHIYVSEYKIPEEFIEEKIFIGSDFNDYIIVNSKNLASIVSNMKTIDNTKIRKILDGKNICYEVINSNAGGRSNYILYRIYPYRIVNKSDKNIY